MPAHAVSPKLVGTLLAQIADPAPQQFGVIMSRVATDAGGWLDCEWPGPGSGKLGKRASWSVLHKNLVVIAGLCIR